MVMRCSDAVLTGACLAEAGYAIEGDLEDAEDGGCLLAAPQHECDRRGWRQHITARHHLVAAPRHYA
jgi:hypothetical protein